MKKLLSVALGLGLVFAVAGTASALAPSDYAAGDAAGGIVDTRHNIGSSGLHFIADNADSNGGTSEICVFCHTPHHANTSAPLWNKALSSGSYTAYGTTVAGTVISASNCTISLACLSCHDGVNTFDTLINAPGKGNGGSNNTTSTNFNWTFTEDSNTQLDFLNSTRLNIGTSLADDHPVCVPYYDDRASLRPTSTTIGSVSMLGGNLTASDDTSSTTYADNVWAVKGYLSSAATIGDLLRGSALNQVECSSCHDPHFDNKSWDETHSTWQDTAAGIVGSEDTNGLFLRRVGGNSLSGVCRTCHNK